jgi:hypothetical protein
VPWVVNALTGERVTSPVDWLIGRLAELNSPTDDGFSAHLATRHAHVVGYHAHQIRGHWLTWRHRGDNWAVQVRGRQRPRAVPVQVDGGHWKGLRRLLRAARGRSDRIWQTAWLGTPSDTRRLLGWRPPGAGFEVRLRGLHAVMPTRAIAAPLIEAALRRHEAIPGRRHRQCDALADDFARAVALAHFKLTGRRGVYRDEGGYTGDLLKLARDIEVRLECAGLLSAHRLATIF